MNSPPRPSGQSIDPQLALQLQSEILARHSLFVTIRWINLFLSSVKEPRPPLPALASTAHFRLLFSDFTNSLSKSIPVSTSEALLLPRAIADVQIKSYTLTINTPVQVLDIEDVGSSKWSQIEALERIERGEEIRGREVIRHVPSMNDGDEGSDQPSTVDASISNANHGNVAHSTSTTPSAKKTQGPHKLLLSDSAHNKVQAFELIKVPKIFISTSVDAQDDGICIGTKLLLKKGTVVRRGLVMLTPENIVVLGGKVEVWHQTWRTTRKQGLLDGLQRAAAVNDH